MEIHDLHLVFMEKGIYNDKYGIFADNTGIGYEKQAVFSVGWYRFLLFCLPAAFVD